VCFSEIELCGVELFDSLHHSRGVLRDALFSQCGSMVVFWFGYCEGIHDCTTSQNITVRSATFEIKPARTNAQSSSGSRRLP